MGNNINELIVRNEAGDLEVIDLLTGEVIRNSSVPTPPPQVIYKFNYHTALYICQQVKQGKTLKEISEEPNMPPVEIVSHWLRTDKMFAAEMQIARKERGEYYHDAAMEIAKTAARGAHKDAVPSMALAIKTFQWGAERAKPESYGNKVTHEGSETKPILMRVINTGISRATKPDVPVEAITTEVTDVKAREEERNEDD